MRISLPTRATGIALALVLARAGVAAAAPTPTVIALDGGDALVDVGGQDGVTAGAELTLLRDVIAKDPVSGQTLRDQFAVGTLAVVRAGDHVALAHPSASLAGKIAIGDHVALADPPTPAADPWQARLVAAQAGPIAAPAEGAAPADPHRAAARVVAATEAARAVWQANLGQPPAARAEAWRAYLAATPDTPLRAAVTTEIASLTRQAKALDRAAQRAAATTPDAARRRALASALADLRHAEAPTASDGAGPLWVDAPTEVVPGQPVTLAFAIRDPAAVDRAWLYVRPHGQPGYTRLPTTPDGDAYLRGTIPAAQVTGDVDWFVEVQHGTDDAEAAIGSAAAPRHLVRADDLAEPPIAQRRSRVSLTADYVDFDGRLGKGHDQYYQAEAEFAYRFLQPVHAIRLGFGTLSGQGGPKDVIDASPDGGCTDASGAYRCKQVDFSYVYTEFEWQVSKLIGFMLRPQAGLLTTDRVRDPGRGGRCRTATELTDCAFTTGVGLRARVRFGEEDGANLIVGVGFTRGVGTLIEAAYHWAPRPMIPIALAVQVTDQPVPEDFGVRIIGDIGYRGAAWVYPSVRLSYQARDLDHAGVSGGLGLNFDW
jgi:hypothetical protein